MSRILIAGPGYIGGILAERLKDDNHVFTLSRSGFDLPGTTSLAYDLGEPLPEGSIPDVDEVYFCLAPKSRDLVRYKSTFIDGLNHVMSRVSNVRLFFISSTSVYGENSGEWVTEESPPHINMGPYGEVLRQAEAIAFDRCKNSVVVRLGGIYGPGRTRLIDRVLEGKEGVISSPRYTNRIHREDCVRMLLFLREKAVSGIYNGVDNDPCDKSVLITWLLAQQKKEVKEVNLDQKPSINKRVSNQKIKALGFRFRYPSFREGYSSILYKK